MNTFTHKLLIPIFLGGALSINSSGVMALLTPKTVTTGVTENTRLTRTSFFQLYEENRRKDRPNYITADFMLLSYSLVRNATLNGLEQKQIQPLFASLLQSLTASLELKNGEAAQLANQDYLAVLSALLTGKQQLASERAQKELALILQAQGIATSPLWEMPMDYSQFKPRGRYSVTEQAQQYFRSMRYAGSVLFALKPSKATGVSATMAKRMTRQAILLTQAMKGNKTAAQLETLLSWQMGVADDLSTQDLIKLIKQPKQATEIQQQALFAYAQKQHKQPKIMAGIVDVSQLAAGTSAADVLTGWRLMPLRYSTESAVFQQMLYPNTGEYTPKCQQCPLPFGVSLLNGKQIKGYPSSKELMALLNSQSAQQWVTKHGEANFQGYSKASQQAKKLITQAQGLNASQLQLLQQWLAPKDLSAEQNKEHLTSALGFWTWQRYINLLYSKQSYSLTGKSVSYATPRPGAKIEKATALYRQLLQLVKQHQKYTPDSAWDEFAQTLERVVKISGKADKLNATEEAFLNALDKIILSDTGGVKDKPIIVDIHSHPGDGVVVEEATGLANVVKQDKAWGARFTQYEFKQPLNNRLNDEQWLLKLQSFTVTPK